MGMSENRAQRAVLERLFALQDTKYRAFQSKLMPTVAPETVIGVRTPLLRNLAKELAGTAEAADFLRVLPHAYYEENNLHAFLVEKIRDYDAALAETERFLPYIDNWATCDCFSPKVFAKHKDELLTPVRRWLLSEKLYTVRYAIGMLMRHYLDADFRPEYLAWVADVQSEEYYLNMSVRGTSPRRSPSSRTTRCRISPSGGSTSGRTTRPFRRPWRAIAFRPN